LGLCPTPCESLLSGPWTFGVGRARRPCTEGFAHLWFSFAGLARAKAWPLTPRPRSSLERRHCLTLAWPDSGRYSRTFVLFAGFGGADNRLALMCCAVPFKIGSGPRPLAWTHLFACACVRMDMSSFRLLWWHVRDGQRVSLGSLELRYHVAALTVSGGVCP